PVLPGRDTAIYARLRAAAPGSHGALLRSGQRSVISHSPECFLRCDGRRVVSDPIKGTRRREPGCEAEARAALLAAAKDNAELAMIVDLVRNDLARVAVQGGVRVDSRASVIDLPYVHHLVARVGADLAPGVAVADMLAAAYPAGSITGAPKIAAMRLLSTLERSPRGAYCGTIGWLGAGAACSLSVAIRTMVLQGEELRLDAGGGIVADSDGGAEWDEALAKAAPMRAAVGAA
ncbi:MAG: chorismate-binding protein, partial [Planctomycetota bacterium]|nr:chorismate-binding protein [Planctomycetota bacterium]